MKLLLRYFHRRVLTFDRNYYDNIDRRQRSSVIWINHNCRFLWPNVTTCRFCRRPDQYLMSFATCSSSGDEYCAVYRIRLGYRHWLYMCSNLKPSSSSSKIRPKNGKLNTEVFENLPTCKIELKNLTVIRRLFWNLKTSLLHYSHCYTTTNN